MSGSEWGVFVCPQVVLKFREVLSFHCLKVQPLKYQHILQVSLWSVQNHSYQVLLFDRVNCGNSSPVWENNRAESWAADSFKNLGSVGSRIHVLVLSSIAHDHLYNPEEVLSTWNVSTVTRVFPSSQKNVWTDLTISVGTCTFCVW